MAEVLITLAIIGVVAAITIPSIVANHQKRALETQFAKTYRTLSQVINLAIAEHGDITGWDLKGDMTNDEQNEFVKKYFLPYFNVVKFCPMTGEWDCLKSVNYTALNGTKKYWHDGRIQRNPLVILADGSVIYFAFNVNTAERPLTINVDLNGEKKPNVLGLDAHPLVAFYSNTGEAVPYATYTTWNEEKGKYEKLAYENVLADCNREGVGIYCAQRIIKEGFKINY